MNNVQIDGATERDVFGLGSTGAPGAEVNAKSLSIEAVKELQILLAPFDVRQGNFGGFLLNAITKSGTNELHGSVFHAFRNQSYGRRHRRRARSAVQPLADGLLARRAAHPRQASLLHGERVDHREYARHRAVRRPAQPPRRRSSRYSPTRSPASFNLMKQLGSQEVGSAGGVNIPNPLTNVFARSTGRSIPCTAWCSATTTPTVSACGSRLRRTIPRCGALRQLHNFRNVKSAPVLQLFSNFANGASNELFVGYNKWFNRRDPLSAFPQIRVNNGRRASTAPRHPRRSPTSSRRATSSTPGRTSSPRTTPSGRLATTSSRSGTRNEYVWLRNQFHPELVRRLVVPQPRQHGRRQLPTPSVRRSSSADGGNVYYTGLQNAFYAQDQWAVTNRPRGDRWHALRLQQLARRHQLQRGHRFGVRPADG
jgi:hypothetical protein